jgi:hypothetical protein
MRQVLLAPALGRFSTVFSVSRSRCWLRGRRLHDAGIHDQPLGMNFNCWLSISKIVGLIARFRPVVAGNATTGVRPGSSAQRRALWRRFQRFGQLPLQRRGAHAYLCGYPLHRSTLRRQQIEPRLLLVFAASLGSIDAATILTWGPHGGRYRSSRNK